MKTPVFYPVISAICLVWAIAGCSSPKVLINNWQDKPLIADLNDSAWFENAQYDTKNKFWYKMSNDDNNLYIMFKTGDETLKRKILRLGLTVWIDPSNHKKEKYGIHYPQGRGKSGMNSGMNEERMPNRDRNSGQTDRSGERLLAELQVIELYGFNNRDDDVLMIAESKIKPIIAFGKDNALIYECTLPLQYFSTNTSKVPISIGFITGYIENTANGGQNRDMGSRGNGGGMSGRGGMGGRGGMNSGGGRMSGGDRESGKNSVDAQQLSHPTKSWIKDYSLIKQLKPY